MLAYNDVGRGAVVVLIHGFCEGKWIWANFEDRLSENYRVITLDLPGFGESLEYPESPSMEYYAESVFNCLNNLKIIRATIIGHSMGGYVALSMAQLFPQLVDKLVLINSSLFPDTSEKKIYRNKTIDFIERKGISAFISSFVPPLFYTENRERCAEYIRHFKSSASLLNEDAVVGCISAMRDRKGHSQLKGIISPVLFIAGNKDVVVPMDVIRQQLDANPSITNVIIENCGHMALFEFEEKCLTEINNFI